MKRILVTGAFGQIGSELVPALAQTFGFDNVIAMGYMTRAQTPIRLPPAGGPVVFGDVTNKSDLRNIVTKNQIDSIYHLAAILSAKGEQNPQVAYEINMTGTYNVLEIARELKLSQVIIPSSMAAFGPDTPKENTPNETLMRPTTMYGINKVAGELLANYYFQKYGLDVRGMRFPGIISSEALPGGGTTDYAVAIYYEALQKGSYECFVRADTVLPMMYMPDAIKALIDLPAAPLSKLKHHADYNVASMSFSASELAAEIQKHIPSFKVSYKPDFRQKIADSWPRSLDDSCARAEWNWKPSHNLASMTIDMLEKLAPKLTGKPFVSALKKKR